MNSLPSIPSVDVVDALVYASVTVADTGRQRGDPEHSERGSVNVERGWGWRCIIRDLTDLCTNSSGARRRLSALTTLLPQSHNSKIHSELSSSSSSREARIRHGPSSPS